MRSMVEGAPVYQDNPNRRSPLHRPSGGPPPPFRFAEQGRISSPGRAGGDDAKHGGGGSGLSGLSSTAAAPSTALRAVPLPRSASRNRGGLARPRPFRLLALVR